MKMTLDQALIREYWKYQNFRAYIEESSWDEILLGSEDTLDNICLCVIDFSFFYFGTSFLISILSK